MIAAAQILGYTGFGLLVFILSHHQDIGKKLTENKRLLIGLACALMAWFDIGYQVILVAALYLGLAQLGRYWYEKLLGEKTSGNSISAEDPTFKK